MMRVIITGGTGLIGSTLSADLVGDGHDVIALSRSPQKKAPTLPDAVQVVGWDARTAEGWGHLAEGADAIVNLAGANLAGTGFFPQRWTAERKRVIRDSRVNAGRAVVDAVENAEQKPRFVIQASGVGYYGDRGDEILDEEASPGDGFLAELAYKDWEPSTAPVEEMGVRRAIIRTGGVFSTEEGALPRLVLPFRLFVGGHIGSGDQWVSWIHIQDEVRAIRFLIEQEEARGAFNLVAPEPMTNAGLGRAIGQVMNRPAWIPLPGFAMKLAFGEVANVLLESQRAIPKRLLDLGFEFRFPEAKAALEDLLSELPAQV
jgi:hypothetical protein